MKAPQIRKQAYEQTAQVFHWATQLNYVTFFTGIDDPRYRHSRTEKLLPRMVKRQELVVTWHGGRLVYAAPRLCKGSSAFRLIEHGLGCTEGIVRFYRADPEGIIVPERRFGGFFTRPDWGLIYPDSMLLYEFTTGDNYYRGKLPQKLTNYTAHLDRIEGEFRRKAAVLFVVDVPRLELEVYLERINADFAFFVDYETFKSVPIGAQLTAPIYLWGMDRKEYSLRNV